MGRIWGLLAFILVSAFALHAKADCVSDCQAATYCDSEMTESGECSDKLNACYAQECNRTRYGAIAYDADSGAYGWSNDLDDAPAAERQALDNCRQNGANCQVIVHFWNQCGAVAAGGGKEVAWGLGATESEAEDNAMAACDKDGGTDCAVQAWSCATP